MVWERFMRFAHAGGPSVAAEPDEARAGGFAPRRLVPGRRVSRHGAAAGFDSWT